jgi:DNA-binding NtrC family response regulator
MKTIFEESGTVLVVDDEAICYFVRRVLEDADYRVLEAHDVAEALEICGRRMERIDLLLTGILMPRLSGWALVERAATLRPRMKVVYMPEDVDLVSNQGVLTPDMACLRKPFTRSQVLEKVREVLGSSERRQPLVCPRCSSKKAQRSQRRWIDWLLALIFVAPYRCQDCRIRFHRFGIRRKTNLV